MTLGGRTTTCRSGGQRGLQNCARAVRSRSTSPRTSRGLGGPSSKRTREGSTPSWCATFRSTSGPGNLILNQATRVRLPHGTPCLCRRIRRPRYERSLRWFNSIQRRQCSCRGMRLCASEARNMRFDSAREHRRVEESGYLASLISWSTLVQIQPLATPITLSSGRVFIRRSKRARLPRSARTDPVSSNGPRQRSLKARNVVRSHGQEPEGSALTSAVDIDAER